MLGHTAAVIPCAFPVAIGDLRHDFATFLDGFKDCSDIKVAIKGTFDTDLDIVEIDKNGKLETIRSVQNRVILQRDIGVQTQEIVP
jgi:hypothetical protein